MNCLPLLLGLPRLLPLRAGSRQADGGSQVVREMSVQGDGRDGAAKMGAMGAPRWRLWPLLGSAAERCKLCDEPAALLEARLLAGPKGRGPGIGDSRAAKMENLGPCSAKCGPARALHMWRPRCKMQEQKGPQYPPAAVEIGEKMLRE